MAGINIFEIPALWFPGQNSEEWEKETNDMLQRAIITQKFIMGEIPASDFLEFIDSQGYDCINLAEGWIKENEL